MDRITQFQEKVAQAPDNVLFRFSLGQALLDAGRPEEAAEELQACVAARGDWLLAWMLLGRAQLAQGQTETARTTFAKALELAVAQEHEGPEMELREVLQGM